MSDGLSPKRIVFGNLEGAVRRGQIGRRKSESIARKATHGHLT